MTLNIRVHAINKLIGLGYNERTAPHIVDAVFEVFAEYTPKDILSPVIINGPLSINTTMREAWFNGAEIPLTPKEFVLLEYLIRNAGTLLTVKNIIKNVWPLSSESAFHVEYVRVYIGSLRKKLPLCKIITKPGEGYYLERAR